MAFSALQKGFLCLEGTISLLLSQMPKSWLLVLVYIPTVPAHYSSIIFKGGKPPCLWFLDTASKKKKETTRK